VAVNMDQPQLWKKDVASSVDMYNDWFLEFAPKTFRTQRLLATTAVEASLRATDYLANVLPATIIANPTILPTLRMSTCPPLAVDRLIGLASANPTLVKRLDKLGKLPLRVDKISIKEATGAKLLNIELEKIGSIIKKMADKDIFVWLGRGTAPTSEEIHRAATIVADRVCGSQANPIIRNEQERRQLLLIKEWLEARGYREVDAKGRNADGTLPPGTFCFRFNIAVNQPGTTKTVNIPVDAVIMPKSAKAGDEPIMIEAKSAGDFTNTNKRRKEEAQKVGQLRKTIGEHVRFVLFLCGYFDSGYLGYEAAEGIDWIWEHRIDDLAKLGL
jgi:hypothetical protein